MGVFNTRPRFNNVQIKQLSGDTITLSGTTNISGTFRYLPGATVGYVLKSIDSNGTVGWQPVSVSADTNTFVTGGTLSGNNLILGWNTGGSASPIDLSSLSDTTYWTAGTSGTGSIRVTNGGTTDATGNYAVAQGFNTLASGYASHTEGGETTAIGNYSIAEGYQTTSIGNSSHAEGQSTTSFGIVSHSEGRDTRAIGDYSHAEGYLTTATGNTSHAEGYQTKAYGVYSHAEGNFTTAIGNNSHAEGILTKAIGQNSHTEGGSNTSIGDASHTEGNQTTAIGTASHAEGFQTISISNNSHAEGRQTTASGLESHTEGRQTTAIGDYSHAGGYNSTASGTTSFIHSTDSEIKANYSALLGGQNLTGTTDNTVYVPNLTIRGDHTLHSDSTLEVVDIPSNFENLIKGSFTDFNWDGITTSLLNNNNPSGSTSFLLGNFSPYPTIKNHGFLSYYGTGYTRTGTPTTGTDFYRNKMVLKTAEDSEGTIFSNAGITSWWWENSGESRMKLTSGGNLGLGLNTNGLENPTSKLDISGTTGYQQLRLRTNYTPSSTADTNGAVGDIAWDNNYLYIKTGTGWGRLALDYVF